MSYDFYCWFPGISGFLLLGVRMWTFRLKEQGVFDTGDERLIRCCKGIQAWRHACLKVSSSCAAWACQSCHPSPPRGLTDFGSGRETVVRWAVKAACKEVTRMVTLPLSWTLWATSTERWPLEIWYFDDCCNLKRLPAELAVSEPLFWRASVLGREEVDTLDSQGWYG